MEKQTVITDELVEAAAEGKEPERSELMTALYSSVRVMVNARLMPNDSQREAAEDLVQDVMVGLREGLGALRERTAAGVKGYASMIAARRVADYLRGRGQEGRKAGAKSLNSEVLAGVSRASPLWAMLSASGASPMSEADQRDLAGRVMGALVTLKEGHREVITLAFFDQLETREIAERMGVSRPAASMLVIRAVKALRRELTGQSTVQGGRGEDAHGDDV